MFKLQNVAKRATKYITIASLLCSFAASAQTTIKDNATQSLAVTNTPRNWAVLVSEVSPNSDLAPVITRTSGSTTSACLDNTNNVQQTATFSLSVPTLQNITYTWKAVGGIEIVGSTTSQTVTVRPKSGSTFPGKLLVDYKGTITSTRTVPYTYQNCVCVGSVTTCTPTVGTTTFTDLNNFKGQAFVNLAQKFTQNFNIVGPRCIAQGEVLTYSIAPLVSSYEAFDGYNWFNTPSGFTASNGIFPGGYSSLDNSSVTVTATNIPTSLSVNVGACNQNASDTKTIVFGTKMAKPAAAIAGQSVKNPCLDASVSQIVLSASTLGATATDVDYRWISDIAGTTVVAGSLTSSSVTLNIGSNAGKVYLQASPKTGGAFCTLNGPLFDTITINRGFTSATVTGPNGTTAATCLSIGQTYQYSATVGGVAIGVPVNWVLPAGMVFSPASPVQTTSTITVAVTGVVATGASINGSIATGPGICSGNIVGLSNLKTAPSLTAITGPNPSTLNPTTVFCAAPGATNVLYNATAANFDFITWASTGGITGGGSTTYTAGFSNPFTTGTLTAFASRSGCPNTNPVTITVKSNAATATLATLTSSKSCYNLGTPDQVTLTTDPGYLSYTWTLPATWTVVSGANTNVLTFNTNGTTGTVTVRGVNECQTTVARSITLTANGVGTPITLAVTSVTGAISYTAPFIAGATYEWFKNGSTTAIAGQNSNILQLTTPTTTANTFCVVVTLGSCKSAGTCATTPANSFTNARIADTESVLTAYPSPANDNITVSIPNPSKALATINVYQQATGMKLKNVTTNNSSYVFDSTTWASGIYTVETILNGETKTISVVVEH